MDYADKKLRINSVCPGAIQTPMIDRFVGGATKERNELVAQYPMGRFGRSQEVAEAIVWFYSNKASFITGQTLAVDGEFIVH